MTTALISRLSVPVVENQVTEAHGHNDCHRVTSDAGHAAATFDQLPEEVILLSHEQRNFALECASFPLLLWIFSAVDVIHLTNRRIVIKKTRKFLTIPVTAFEEYFRYTELQHVSIRRSINYLWLLISIALALFVGGCRVSGLDVYQNSIFIWALLSLSAVLFLSSWFKAFLGCHLVLDLYKRQTVHSWLPLKGWSILAMKHGSSTQRSLRLKSTDCYETMYWLFAYHKTRCAEEE